MRKFKFNIFIVFLLLLVIFSSNYKVFASAEKVYVGGFPSGFVINTDGAEVVGLCDVYTKESVLSPSKDAGVLIGDIVISLNGVRIKDAVDIEKALKNYDGITTNITILRNGEEKNFLIKPVKDFGSDKYKIGLFIRDCMSGIGTMTYVKQNYRFGALGHPVLNQKNELYDINESQVFLCNIIGVNKGLKGKPGELRGVFIKDKVIGVADKNTEHGIFGCFEKDTGLLNENMLMDISSNVKPGKANILATVSGTAPKEYSVNIVKVDKYDKQNKNLVIKITDKELLEETGGIVQGMSGSPIIQGGKLVGAVTHVFVNDPTRGFGILIEKMINE